MHGKKEILARLLAISGINRVLFKTLRGITQDLKILAYHRICDVDDYNDPELVSASIDQFDWQIKYIKENLNPITFYDVVECYKNNERLPPNSVIITFDDGFGDNYYNAFPILKKHNIPAVMYISTGYIDSNKPYWFNQVCNMIMSATENKVNVNTEHYSIPVELSSRHELVNDLLVKLKLLSNIDRINEIESISEQLNFSQATDDQLSLPMSWEQVVEMSNQNIEIGSHTVSHPILSSMSDDEVRYEIHESKKAIESHTGKPVVSISYPEGMMYAYNNCVIDNVIEASYEFGASYESGTNYRSSLDRYQLKRIHIERYVSNELFASMLSLPEIFS